MDSHGPENRCEKHQTWLTCHKRVKISCDADSIIPDGLSCDHNWDEILRLVFLPKEEAIILYIMKIKFRRLEKSLSSIIRHGDNEVLNLAVSVCLFYHHLFVLRVEYFHISLLIISRSGYCELPDTLRRKWKFCQEIIPPKICRLTNFIISIMSFYLEGVFAGRTAVNFKHGLPPWISCLKKKLQKK